MTEAIWAGTEQLEVVQNRNAKPNRVAPGCVLLRITVAGVCGTDVHIWEGRLSFTRPPLVLGHEFAGVVEEVGAGVQSFAPGDRVKCDSVVGCGDCFWCRQGATQFCATGAEFGITRDGGWTQWLEAPERNLHHLPDAIPDEVAAIMDVEVAGALRKPGISGGETVVVFGAGPAGLIALQCARILGAGAVILCGTRSERLELGRRLGADHVIDVNRADAVAEVRRITNGLGADLAFDAAGSETAILNALEVVRPQGRVVFYGVPERAVREFPLRDAVLKDVVMFGALSNRTGWDELIGWVASGRLNLQSLITHRFPLERAGEALATMRDRRDGAIKAVLQIG
jgi:threonine dehydrogenase-like Zn-dependent dehydrogenase